MILARRQFVLGTLLLALLGLVGCNKSALAPQTAQQVTLSPQQQQQLALTQQQMQQRATALDTDNQELEKLLAQARQQNELLTDQMLATQDQFKATIERLASTQQESSELRTRTQALTASMQQNGGAGGFRPNNTLLRPLTVANIPGVAVRQDGDTIRVALASEALFQPGTATLKPGADATIRNVASELFTNYPEHYIGIEGHTSNNEPVSPQYPTTHDLSSAQASAVFHTLRQSLGVSPDQLMVVAQGANHPRVSNATIEGQNQNRRIELVVYPETTRRR